MIAPPDRDEVARLVGAVQGRGERLRVGGGDRIGAVVPEGDVPLPAHPHLVEGLPVELEVESQTEGGIRLHDLHVGALQLGQGLLPTEGPRGRLAHRRQDQDREGERPQDVAPHHHSHTRRLPTSAPEPGNGKGLPLPRLHERESTARRPTTFPRMAGRSRGRRRARLPAMRLARPLDFLQQHAPALREVVRSHTRFQGSIADRNRKGPFMSSLTGPARHPLLLSWPHSRNSPASSASKAPLRAPAGAPAGAPRASLRSETSRLERPRFRFGGTDWENFFCIEMCRW